MTVQLVKVILILLVVFYFSLWTYKQFILRYKSLRSDRQKFDVQQLLRKVENVSPTQERTSSIVPSGVTKTGNEDPMILLELDFVRLWRSNMRRLFENNYRDWAVLPSYFTMVNSEVLALNRKFFSIILRGKKPTRSGGTNSKQHRDKKLTNSSYFRDNMTKPSWVKTKNDEPALYWGRRALLKCLATSPQKTVESDSGYAGEVKITSLIWTACGTQGAGRSVLSHVYSLWRSLRALRKIWSALLKTYNQEEKNLISHANRPESIARNQNLHNISHYVIYKMKVFIKSWSARLYQKQSKCFRCLPLWGRYVYLTRRAITKSDIAGQNLTHQVSTDVQAASISRKASIGSKSNSLSYRHLAPSMASLLAKISLLVQLQGKRIQEINSSLNQLVFNLGAPHAPAKNISHHELNTSSPLSERVFSSYMGNSEGKDSNIFSIGSLCQALCSNMNNILQSTNNWIHCTWSRLYEGAALIRDKISLMQTLSFKSICDWAVGKYNGFVRESFTKLQSNRSKNVSADRPVRHPQPDTKRIKQSNNNLKVDVEENGKMIRPLISSKSKTLKIDSNMETDTNKSTRLKFKESMFFQGSKNTRDGDHLNGASVRHGGSEFQASHQRQSNAAPVPSSDNSKLPISSSVSRLDSHKWTLNVFRKWIANYIIHTLRDHANHVRDIGEIKGNSGNVGITSANVEKVKVNKSSLRHLGEKNKEKTTFQKVIVETVSRFNRENVTDSERRKEQGALNKKSDVSTSVGPDNESSQSRKIIHNSRLKKNGLERLVSLWELNSRQLSRLLKWLLLLPQRTLSFIRRLELMNLKLRVDFFKRILQVNHIDAGQGHVKNVKDERQKQQRDVFTIHMVDKVDYKKDENLANPNIEDPQQFQYFKKSEKKERMKRSSMPRKQDVNLRVTGNKSGSLNKLTQNELLDLASSKAVGDVRFFRKVSKDNRRLTVPVSRRFSKEDADALRSKLLRMIHLVESRRNLTSEYDHGFASKERKTNSGMNRITNFIPKEKADDSDNTAVDENLESVEPFYSNAPNNEPTEADFELLNNIEMLTKKFLGMKNKKQFKGYTIKPKNNQGSNLMRNRMKRSEDIDEGTAEELQELGETASKQKLAETGLEDKVKESKQFLHRWGTLRKQAQNLQTEINSARDKYASASDEMALLLKKGNEIQDNVVSASSAQGAHKSMLEENWKNVNREFDKFKNDIAAREREMLSDGKRINAEKIDQTLLKLEDAISEQGDPNDRILGENVVLPFNLEANKLDPAIKNMKHEAALSEQISSNEVMLESEDAEDDVFKESEAGDYSIVDFDYAPNAKFADEEDYEIAEDADSLTGFDYEVDRHSDSQLEDVDNMLSKLIARRFRSKRHAGQIDSLQDKKSSHSSLNSQDDHNKKKFAAEKKIKRDTASEFTATVHRERRGGLHEAEQTINYDDDNEENPEDQRDLSDVFNDIIGSKLHDETKDPSSESDLDFKFWVNYSNLASRGKFNHINDDLAGKEIKILDKPIRTLRNKSMTNRKLNFQNVSDLLGFDARELGVEVKQLNGEMKKENPEAVVVLPLGSDIDIEDGIEEIKKEKELLTAASEKIDEDIPGNDELEPYDQIIEESMEDFKENGIRDEDAILVKQGNNLQQTELNLFDANNEKERFEIASSFQKKRKEERRQHDVDKTEIETINKGLEKAISDLTKATNDIGKSPPKPDRGDQVRSLYEEDIGNIEPTYSRIQSARTGARTDTGDGLINSRESLVEIDALKKRRSIEKISRVVTPSDLPQERSGKGRHINATIHNATNNSEHSMIVAMPYASSRSKREANSTLEEEDDMSSSTEYSAINSFGDEFDEDERFDAGSYVDDVYDMDEDDDDDDVRIEEWEQNKLPTKRKKPKPNLKSKKGDIDGQLLDAKSVVRQLKEEEDIADFILPPDSMVSSERDLLEFGRKPDAKDVFVNIVEPVGLAELSDAELKELNGPVISSTDIERSLEDPVELVTALEGIENEIKATKLAVLSQTRSIAQQGGQVLKDGLVRSTGLVDEDESVEEVFRQINRAEDIGNEALEKKVIDERYDLLEDARKTRLRQELIDKEDNENVALDGSVLGEALQDLDQFAVDKSVESLRNLVSFKDVQKEKRD